MNYNGNNGIVQACTSGETPAAIGEITSFSISTACATQDATTLGDEWNKNEPGRKSWEASINAFYDPDDAAQIDLDTGAKVDVEFLPESAHKLAGTGVVSAVEIGEINADERIPVSFSLTGTGPIVKTSI